ncbi:MAG: LuxR family transcriptional regulator [Rhizobiales bacterium]|nr:LuxR family transcriptional regulator [Hyphomicrobiales bacterium]
MRFGEVAYLAYEATLSPERWTAALDGVAGLFGARGALVYACADGVWSVALHSAHLSEAVHAYRAEGWWQRNPWLEPPGSFEFRAGDVYRDEDVLKPRQLAYDPFYVEFLPRFGLKWQMAAVIHSDLGSPTGLIVQRGPEAGSFEQKEMDDLLAISRHVEQALRISARIDDGTAAHGTVANAFDALDRPAFILDGDHRPVVVNRSAAPLVERCFAREGESLRTLRPEDQGAFSAAIRDAHADTPKAPRPTTVTDPEGGKVALWTVPLVGQSAQRLGIRKPDRHVLVVGQRVREGGAVDPVFIRDMLGLTLGEARLASRIAAGRSVRDAAVELGITEGTARIVLKRAFARLGIHRQSDLVARVAALES